MLWLAVVLLLSLPLTGATITPDTTAFAAGITSNSSLLLRQSNKSNTGAAGRNGTFAAPPPSAPYNWSATNNSLQWELTLESASIQQLISAAKTNPVLRSMPMLWDALQHPEKKRQKVCNDTLLSNCVWVRWSNSTGATFKGAAQPHGRVTLVPMQQTRSSRP